MEHARMEWNGRFQEWNGRLSSILPYQFHARFCALRLQKNIYGCRVVEIILLQQNSTSISTSIICQQIAVLRLCLLRRQWTHCIIVVTMQFAALMLWLTTLQVWIVFVFKIDNFAKSYYFFLPQENSLRFHPRFSLIGTSATLCIGSPHFVSSKIYEFVNKKKKRYNFVTAQGRNLKF